MAATVSGFRKLQQCSEIAHDVPLKAKYFILKLICLSEYQIILPIP